MRPIILNGGLLEKIRFVAELESGKKDGPHTGAKGDETKKEKMASNLFVARFIWFGLDLDLPLCDSPSSKTLFENLAPTLQYKRVLDRVIKLVGQDDGLPRVGLFGYDWEVGESNHLACFKTSFIDTVKSLHPRPIIAGHPISCEGNYYVPCLQDGEIKVRPVGEIFGCPEFLFLATCRCEGDSSLS